MRHGPAEDRAPSGRDADRGLTPAGREVVERAARALARQRAGGTAPLRIVTSPFRRARETAEVVAARIAAAAPELHDDLAADAGLPLSLIHDLHAVGTDALVVGHQPTVEELVRALVPSTHPVSPGHPPHAMPKGFRTATIAVLDRSGEDPWRLIDVLDPHALDR